MKKLILILLLFGLSAVGADKPLRFFSINNLEGFGKGGITIEVVDYSDEDKTFNEKAIENQVELRLRQSGVKVNYDSIAAQTGSTNYLLINAMPVTYNGSLIGYAVTIHAKRAITFEANDKTYWKGSTGVWYTGGLVSKGNLKTDINNYMDQFLLDYLKANPKKEKE